MYWVSCHTLLVQRIRGINGLVCDCIGFHAINYNQFNIRNCSVSLILSTLAQGNDRIGAKVALMKTRQPQTRSHNYRHITHQSDHSPDPLYLFFPFSVFDASLRERHSQTETLKGQTHRSAPTKSRAVGANLCVRPPSYVLALLETEFGNEE